MKYQFDIVSFLNSTNFVYNHGVHNFGCSEVEA